MDGRRFDALTRTLTAPGSRRRFLRLLGSGLLGRPRLRASPAGTKGADGPIRGERCRRQRDCPGAPRCRNGRCVCRWDRERCRNACCRPDEICCNPLLEICIKPGAPCPR